MWSTALRELKHHPGRYIATLVAIAISVAFLAAASIVTETESNAMNHQLAAPFTQADLVVTPTRDANDPASDPTHELTVDDITNAIKRTAGVSQAEPAYVDRTEVSTAAQSQAGLMTAVQTGSLSTLRLKEGEAPQGAQVVLNEALMGLLKVSLGDTVQLDGHAMTVVGVSRDPKSQMLGNPVYVDQAWFIQNQGVNSVYRTEWLIDLVPGTDPTTAVHDLHQSLTDAGVAQADILTGDQFLAKAATEFTNGIAVLKYVLWVFAGIALIVGLITIANTFTILLTGRRRQIGLIRAIGATGSQVRHSIWAEAAILGLVGGLLGIGLASALTAGLGLYTGSIAYGLVMPWTETIASVGLGMIITFIACVGPARRATRVTPVEALQPASSTVDRRRVSVIRAIVCGLLVAIGVAGSVIALRADENALIIAVAAAACLAIGVLFGARLFVPRILAALGLIVAHWGSIGSIATKNVIRDPRRAAATATALMLAVGLITTLQVGSASVTRTVTDKLEAEFPVALSVVSLAPTNAPAPIPASVTSALARVKGITGTVEIPCKYVPMTSQDSSATFVQVCSYVSGIAAIAPGAGSVVNDDEFWVGEHFEVYQDGQWVPASGATVRLPGAKGAVELRGVESALVPPTQQWSFVTPATYDRLNGSSVAPMLLFASVDPNGDVMSIQRDVHAITTVNDKAIVGTSGYLLEKYMMQQTMNIIVGTMTALLAVAVVIALVGVSNTLTLSVIERKRESAILRAVGAQKRQLKLMLAVEGLLLTVTGALVGLGAGTYFGWLGAKAVVQQFRSDGVIMPVHFAIDWAQTLGLLAILLIATACASLLPGRRAAKASPVAALADV
ncbi:MAG: ABC transporter permease [Propionibacteriaceae bacterium]|jgi:putative ABC transport system permease protein|nr:ABC transporter permease [Propionibacteriaceae bacterium]